MCMLREVIISHPLLRTFLNPQVEIQRENPRVKTSPLKQGSP